MRKKCAKKNLMVKRKVRLKNKRKKFIITTITLLAIALLSTAIFYKLYINSKDSTLSYSTNI